MKIVVDRGRCSAMGICESIAPDYFEVGDDGQQVVLKDDVAAEDLARIEDAVASCPARALSVDEG